MSDTLRQLIEAAMKRIPWNDSRDEKLTFAGILINAFTPIIAKRERIARLEGQLMEARNWKAYTVSRACRIPELERQLIAAREAKEPDGK